MRAGRGEVHAHKARAALCFAAKRMITDAHRRRRAVPTRRAVLEGVAAAAVVCAGRRWVPEQEVARAAAVAAAATTTAAETGSEVGSLFPFIQSQALHDGPASRSFLQPRF